ncbi:MAG: phosphatase PAP2 family protein [Desulfobulbaceae bacterium]|nr:phosphatase PAP2 family protein [Desulfobulbaceae bacterium]
MRKFQVLFFALALMVAFLPHVCAADSEDTGDVLRAVLPAAALGMTFGLDDQQGRVQFYKSFLSTVAVTYGLKVAIDKEGPDGQDESFPSGHASMAFSAASFVEKRYGWNYGLPAYAAATYVGWSRIDSDNHDPEDVVAGALLGVVCSYIFSTPFEEEVRLEPVAGSGIWGVAVRGLW